jgi:hypothetical protein
VETVAAVEVATAAVKPRIAALADAVVGSGSRVAISGARYPAAPDDGTGVLIHDRPVCVDSHFGSLG